MRIVLCVLLLAAPAFADGILVANIGAGSLTNRPLTVAETSALAGQRTNAVARAAIETAAENGDTTKFTKRERFLIEALYQVAAQSNTNLTRAAFRAQLQTIWNSVP